MENKRNIYKTLILGLGNPILSDDGIGIRIAQELKAWLSKTKKRNDIDVIETSEAGLSLLEYIAGYDRLILIDSIKTFKAKPGTVHKFKIGNFAPSSYVTHSHGIDFATAVELGKRLGYKIPEEIHIYAIEVEDNTTICEKLTKKLEAKIYDIVKEICDDLNNITDL